MSTPAEELQKILKTLSDATRVRILWLLEREEMVVQELMEVLGMAQSRVSRHLSILREAGLLEDRRNGTFVSYRLVAPTSQPWQDAWHWVRKSLEDDPTAERDRVVLARVIEARSGRSGGFFDALGPEWDGLRKVFNDDLLRANAIARLIAPGQKVADIGTGTGVLAMELAALGLDVIGIDRSTQMLAAAREKFERAGVANVELREGDAYALPIADAEVSAAFAHMVLQYLEVPANAILEMTRVVRPGGGVVLADFVRHEREWMRTELGVRWQGFELAEVEGWLEAAGLVDARIQTFDVPGHGRDLPATFIASASRPAA